MDDSSESSFESFREDSISGDSSHADLLQQLWPDSSENLPIPSHQRSPIVSQHRLADVSAEPANLEDEEHNKALASLMFGSPDESFESPQKENANSRAAVENIDPRSSVEYLLHAKVNVPKSAETHGVASPGTHIEFSNVPSSSSKLESTGVPGMYAVVAPSSKVEITKNVSSQQPGRSNILTTSTSSGTELESVLQTTSALLKRLNLGPPQEPTSVSTPISHQHTLARPMSSQDYLASKNLDARLFAPREAPKSSKTIRARRELPAPPATRFSPTYRQPTTSQPLSGAVAVPDLLTTAPQPRSPSKPSRQDPALFGDRGRQQTVEPSNTVVEPTTFATPPAVIGQSLTTQIVDPTASKLHRKHTSEFARTFGNSHPPSTIARMPGAYPSSDSSTSFALPSHNNDRPQTKFLHLSFSVSGVAGGSSSRYPSANASTEFEDIEGDLGGVVLPYGVSDHMTKEDASKTIKSLFAAVLQSDQAAAKSEDYMKPEDLTVDLLPHQITGVQWMAGAWNIVNKVQIFLSVVGFSISTGES
ncbi:hypothetical protein HDU93_008932 [Gonapodya sp. JEL0774]|nr:hypothetical protein HDU93_008932 [Gonapodya sp. JEL0774]